MNPIAFNLFGLDVHYYGICVGLGFFIAVYALQRKRVWAALSEDQVINYTLITMIAGIVGARLNFVIKYNHLFDKKSFFEYFAIWNGGLVFYGGFICAALTLLVLCRYKKLQLARVTDLFAVGIPLGHMFGRIGCFMQGCCFGEKSNSVIAFAYPNTQNASGQYNYTEIFSHFNGFPKLVPIQLLEAGSNLILFLILYNLIGHCKKGIVTGLYLVGYGVIRFILEFFRGEYLAQDMLFGIFSPGQQIGLLVIPIGIIVILISFFKSKREINV